MTISLSIIGNLIIALLLLLILWLILKQFPFIAPYQKIVDLVILVIAVIFVIMALSGNPPVRIVDADDSLGNAKVLLRALA